MLWGFKLGKMIKWYLATAFVGSIPMLIRLFLYFILSDRASFHVIAVSDVILWGLVLNISIFNERDRYFVNNPAISSISTIFSVSLIVAFAVAYTCGLHSEMLPLLINQEALLYASEMFAFGTFVVGFVFIIFCSPFLIKKGESESESKNTNIEGVKYG